MVNTAAQKALKARFGPPKGPDNLLRRERMLTEWSALLERQLTLCIAPPGFGKTTLLARWYRQLEEAGYPVVWLSPHAADADPASLLHSLEAGVRRALGSGGLVEEHAHDLVASALPHARALQRLLLLLARVEAPLVLFLDNYQEIDNPETAALFEELLQRAGDDCHVVIASRSEPLFRYGALLLNGQARQFDTDALKFDADETVGFVRGSVAGVALSEEELALIHQKTEGWPIAVQLCCLLVNRQQSALFLRNFSGRDVDLGQFLNEQVFRLLGEELQRFAAQAALFDNFCAPLCDAALARGDSAALIAELVRQKLFIYSLDRNGVWFRFHQMFREFLLGTRWRPGGAEETAMLTAASQWLRAAGRPLEAIGYAVRAPDYALARELLIASAETVVRDEGLLPNLLQWSRKIPVEDTPASIDLRFWTAWSMAFSCRYLEAEREMRQLERSLAESANLDRRQLARYRAHIGSLRVAIRTFEDRSLTVYNTSEPWLAKYRRSADPFHVGVCAAARFISGRLQLEVMEAKRGIELAKTVIARAHSLYGRMWILTLDSLAQMEFGDYRLARQSLLEGYNETLGPSESLQRQSQLLPQIPTGEVSVIQSTMALLLAKVTFEQGETEAALGYLRAGYVHIMEHGLIETAAAGLEVRCYSEAQKDPARALGELKKAEFLIGHYPPRLRFVLRQLGFNLLLNAGAIDEARHEAALMGIASEGVAPAGDGEERNPLVDQQRQVVMVKLLLLDGRSAAARELLQQLLTVASTAQRPRFQVELLVLDAAAQLQAGQAQGACRTFMKALAIAVRNGLYQVFLESRHFSQPVLQQLLQRRAAGSGDEDALLARLGAALALPATAVPEARRAEPLTRRERELLALLATGLSVQGLADHLFVSRATVKWHLHNLYGKLGVRSRAAAIAWARHHPDA